MSLKVPWLAAARITRQIEHLVTNKGRIDTPEGSSMPVNLLSRHLAMAALCASALLGSTLAQAQSGPEPTEAMLLSGEGPYTYQTAVIPTPQGYGSGTVYYPTNGPSKVGLVITAPGFIEPQDVMDFWARRLASFGIATVTMGTKSTTDLPPSREKQMQAALKQVLAMNKVSSSPFYNLIDETRIGAMGHSMGGGGTLLLGKDTPSLKAIIPGAPWSLTTKNFPTLKVPTMLMACQGDVIAPVSGHADRFWRSFNKSFPAVFVEYANTDHFCTTAMANDETQASLGKVGVAWMKRFIDGDTRYSKFVVRDSKFSRFIVQGPGF
jgi:dienelactone hydrolase